MQKNAVPKAVIWRLPYYYCCLRDLDLHAVERISSEEMAELMKVTSSQVRQDLSYFGTFGMKGYGYNVRQLLISLGNILGINEINHMIVVGVGTFGRALLQNFPFSQYGFAVDAAFSASSKTIGSSVSGVPVYHINKLEEFVKNHNIKIAALTLSPPDAQNVVDLLTRCGITGFWNFTGVELTSGVSQAAFEDIQFANSLLRLNYRMKHPAQ